MESYEIIEHGDKDNYAAAKSRKNLKFLVLKLRGVYEIILFTNTITHSNVFRDMQDKSSIELLGGGKINAKEIAWESKSLKDDYGYDRPSDTGELDRILAEVTAKIREKLQW